MTTEQVNDHVTAVALRAIAIAHEHQHERATLEHILAALLERSDVQTCLTDFGIDHQALQTEIATFLIDTTHQRVQEAPGRSREFDMVMGRTIAFTQFSSRRAPNGVDILVQLVQMPADSLAVTLLLRANLDTLRLKRYLAHGIVRHTVRGDPETDNAPTDQTDAISYIKKYCTDLNDLAKTGKIDPMIGRLTELDRITQIIARRTKNNVALVGESGTGKTAIVEGLAYNIVHGDVPMVLRNSTIWSLDVGALVAGTRLRGDFEERIKFLLKAFALIQHDGPILFIDEIHTIMDAGSGHKGSTLDVSNLLKPALARGALRCIGSTTDKDWRQYFEKDRALLRRFKKLLIDEPSSADTKLILRGQRDAYERYHDVSYTDAALDAAVDLTVRYVHDARLPDKAIDVIDEAGARQRITDEGRQRLIDVAEVEIEVGRIVKIPANEIQESEAVKFQRLESDLMATVFGQTTAIRALVDAALINRAGLRAANKPEGSFLFVGPSGVGKSETARQLAKTLGLPLVKFDMSEYIERHSVAKFIGAPPGYVGFGDGGAGDGLLINAVDKNPACVLLLDEIEKAHADIMNLLLQVMDDATLTNSAGKTVNFRNVILIMTSNIGVAATEQHGIGFLPEIGTIDEKAVQHAFSTEFRNRLDAIVTFASLDHASIKCVVQKFIGELRTMLSARNVKIEITSDAEEWLVQHGHDAVYGARPLERLIHRKIKQPLSRLILFGALRDGGTARCSVENNDLIVGECYEIECSDSLARVDQ